MGIGSFACTFLGMAIATAAGWLIVRRGLGQLGAARAYRSVAEQLGLMPDTRGTSLHGFVRGRRVWVGPTNNRDGTQTLIATVALTQPLGIGLTVSHTPKWRLVLQRIMPTQTTTPSTPLIINAQYPTTAADLMNEDVRRVMTVLAQQWPELRVDDYCVTVTLTHPIIRGTTLRQLVVDLGDLAAILESRRVHCQPPPYAAALSSEWATVAVQYGLTLEPRGPVLTGHLNGDPLCIAPNAHGRTATVHVVRRHIGQLGLLIGDQRRSDVANRAGQDITLGMPFFDRSFLVKGFDPDKIRAIIDTPTQDALVRLKGLGRVRIDDHALTLRNVSATPTALNGALDNLLIVSQCIGKN